VATAEISDKAWQFFLTTIRDAGPDFPLIQAWRDARDVGRKMGWAWPSYPTAYRRWTGLSEAQRLEARRGRADAARWLTQPAQRDKTSIGPLEWVSLDGRMLDFWVDWGDGRAVRPIMLALVDVATNMVLDYGLAPSENAADTVRVIKRICQTFGIPDRIYTDNGSSFAGHMVAGGNVHRFRNGGKKPEGIQPPGICKQMGIKLHFALPGNGQAKIAERTFATLSRVIDDRPEFKSAHAGHAPGASSDAKVRPVPVQTAMDVLKREVQRHNRETGRRAQGAQGRSYEQMFREGLAIRVMRKPTARQLYLSGLIYSPVAVDRFGMVKKHGWVYGSPQTQEVLLRFHGKGQRILLGRDPDDFSAPAIASDDSGNLICEGIEPVQVGAYGSVEGIRTVARNGTRRCNRWHHQRCRVDAQNSAILTAEIHHGRPRSGIIGRVQCVRAAKAQLPQAKACVHPRPDAINIFVIEENMRIIRGSERLEVVSFPPKQRKDSQRALYRPIKKGGAVSRAALSRVLSVQAWTARAFIAFIAMITLGAPWTLRNRKLDIFQVRSSHLFSSSSPARRWVYSSQSVRMNSIWAKLAMPRRAP